MHNNLHRVKNKPGAYKTRQKIIIVVDWMSPFMLILVIIKVAIIVLPLWVTVLYLTYCSEGDLISLSSKSLLIDCKYIYFVNSNKLFL